jgi:phosphoglycolate phosphatase
MMKITGIIFDLDGTLLNTIEDIAGAMNTVLARRGFPIHPTKKYFRFVGRGGKRLARRALPKWYRSDRAAFACFTEWRREYMTRWAKTTRPYDGIPELLAWLAAKGIKTAVLSNKPHDLTKDMVSAFFPTHPFQIVWGERQGIARKPDPTAAIEIAAIFGSQPETIVYLGDTDVDMQTANRANMFAVGVLWGFRPERELLENGAQRLIRHADELRNLIATL